MLCVHISLALLDQAFLIHWTNHDGVRRFVAAVQVEKGQDLLPEGVFESVNMGPSLHVVKGHLPLLEVHVHTHSLGLWVEGEQYWR